MKYLTAGLESLYTSSQRLCPWINTPEAFAVFVFFLYMIVGVVIVATVYDHQKNKDICKFKYSAKVTHLDISSTQNVFTGAKHFYHVSVEGGHFATVLTVTAEQYAKLLIGKEIEVVEVTTADFETKYVLSEENETLVASTAAGTGDCISASIAANK